jgi:hypothetical protein
MGKVIENHYLENLYATLLGCQVDKNVQNYMDGVRLQL